MGVNSESTEGLEVLIASISGGDQGAFERLVRLWTPRLFSFCHAILRDTQQTEEVVQDVFLKVWQKAGSYDPGRGRASSWIFSVAHHQAIDRLRKNRVRGADLASPSDQTASFPVAGGQGADPWQKIQIEKAMQALSEPQRLALRLAYFEGLSRSEIASRLGEPLGTVKTRLRDALIKLRRNFENSEPGLSIEGGDTSVSCVKGGKA